MMNTMTKSVVVTTEASARTFCIGTTPHAYHRPDPTGATQT